MIYACKDNHFLLSTIDGNVICCIHNLLMVALLMSCIIRPWTNQYFYTNVFVDNSSLEGIATNSSCFHIQTLAFPLGVGRKLWQIE
jgi:hypothetical protein